MRKFALVIIVIYWCCSITSQEWAPSNAEWYYTYNTDMAVGYVKIKVVGDSTIQDKSCKILRQLEYGWIAPGYYDTNNLGDVYTYEEDGIIYVWAESQFYVLYDFTAEVGETWKVINPIDSDTSGVVIVDSISYENVNGQLLKCLFISNFSGCIGFNNTKIIENIGAVNSNMFPFYVDCLAHGLYGGPFRCYFENSNLIYSTEIVSSCDYILSNPRISTINQIELYPNPFSEQIYLDNNSDSEIKVSVYSLTGSIIKNRFVARNSSIMIDMKGFSNNLFIVKLETNRQIKTQLIIRE